MALKPGRDNQAIFDISYFMYSTGNRGGVVCTASGIEPGSGEAMDNASQRVEYAPNPSGRKAIGMLMNDVVNIDQSRQILNRSKDEVQIGDKVTLMRKGWAVTNFVPVAGVAGSPSGTNIPVDAFLGATGLIVTTNSNNTVSGLVLQYTATVNDGFAYPKVGRFLSRVDHEGYAKVFIDL